MKRTLHLIVLCALLLPVAGSRPAPVRADPGVLFVKQVPSGDQDCTDWDNACELQTALGDASSGDEIRVAAGTYKPTDVSDRFVSFELRGGVSLLGGYPAAGGETRDWEVNITTLSGDIGVAGLSGNSYHVVTAGSLVKDTAVLDGFTITGGNADYKSEHWGWGGGMYVDAGSPTIRNVIFEGNRARGGGGMFINGGQPVLENVDFVGNTATVNGGGLHPFNGSSPTLIDVTFSGNTAPNHWGGGMYNLNSDPTLTNVAFSNNTAEAGGGLFSDGGEPVLENVDFVGNTATVNGGGLHTHNGSSPTLTDVTFTGNTAPNHWGGGMYNLNSDPTLTNVAFSNNTAEAGGGLFSDGGHPVLVDVEFSQNSVTMNGGGLHTHNGSSPTLTNVTFTGNTASGNGGAMMNYASSSTTLTNVTFFGNTATDGGALYNCTGCAATLVNSILWGNQPNEVSGDGTGANITYSDIQGAWPGESNISDDPLFVDAGSGDFHLSPDSPCIDAGDNDAPYMPLYDFEGNLRAMDGDGDGTATVDMGIDEVQPSRIYVDQDAVGDNSGVSWVDAFTDLQDAMTWASDGDEIWVAEGTYFPTSDTERAATFQLVSGVTVYGGFDPTDGDVGFQDRDWEANPTILSGDLLGNDGPGFANNNENSYHVLTGSHLDGTTVLDGFTITGGNNDDVTDPWQWGGGVLVEHSNLTIRNAIFLSNHATGGGGMFSDYGQPVLVNVEFKENSAAYGGGLHTYHGSSPTLTNVTFNGNTVTGKGGGMFNLDNSSPTLTGVTFSGNTAAQGGGMSSDGGQPMLNNVEFIGNTATVDGGGLHTLNGSSARLTDVTFSGNTAPIRWGGGMYNLNSNPMLTDVTFSGNTAQAGGGMFSSGGQPALVNVEFNQNSATINGGGLHTHNQSNATLTDVTFGGNTAALNGGGFYNHNSNPTLTNVVFSGNMATSKGGGVFSDEGQPVLFNVQLSLNSAGTNGGGLYTHWSSPTLTNVTFSGNAATQYGGALFNSPGSAPTLVNSILWGDLPDEISGDGSGLTITYSDIEVGEGVWPGTANINAEPQFQDAAGGDLRLQSSSPAIDVGNNAAVTGVTTDLDGNLRILNYTVDLGAYEASSWAPPDACTPGESGTIILIAEVPGDPVTSVTVEGANISQDSGSGCQVTGTMRIQLGGNDVSGVEISGQVDGSGNFRSSIIGPFDLEIAGLTLKVIHSEFIAGELLLYDTSIKIPDEWGGREGPPGEMFKVNSDGLSVMASDDGQTVGLTADSSELSLITFKLPEIKAKDFVLSLEGALETYSEGYKIKASGTLGLPDIGKTEDCSITADVTLYVDTSGQTVMEIDAPSSARAASLAAVGPQISLPSGQAVPIPVSPPQHVVHPPVTESLSDAVDHDVSFDGASPVTGPVPVAGALALRPELANSPLALGWGGIEISAACQCGKGIPIGTTGFELTGVSGTVKLTEEEQSVQLGVTFDSIAKVAGYTAVSVDGSATFQWEPEFFFRLEGVVTILDMFEPGGASLSVSESDGLRLTAFLDSPVAKAHLAGHAWLTQYASCETWKTECGASSCDIICTAGYEVLLKFHLTGSASCKIGLEKGALFRGSALPYPCKCHWVWRWYGGYPSCSWCYVYVYVPPYDIWLASVLAQFGEFTGDRWGLKGTVSFLDFTTGFYVDHVGELSFGDVSSYKLVDAEQLQQARVAWQSAVSSDGPNAAFAGEDTFAFLPGDQVLVHFDLPLAERKPLTLGITDVITSAHVLTQTDTIFSVKADVPLTVTLISPDGVEITPDNYDDPGLGYDVDYTRTISTELLSGTGRVGGEPRWRVIPASNVETFGSVDVRLDATTVFTDVSIDDAPMNYVPVSVGAHAVEIVPAGLSEPVLSAPFDVVTGTDYTVLAIGYDVPEVLVLQDDNSPPEAGNGRVRLVNAAPAVDLLDGTLGGLSFQGVAYGDASDYQAVAAGAYSLTVASATPEPPLGITLTQVTIPDEDVQTLFVSQFDDSEDPLAILQVRDSIADAYGLVTTTIYVVDQALIGYWSVKLEGDTDGANLLVSAVAAPNPPILDQLTVDASELANTLVTYRLLSDYRPVTMRIFANDGPITETRTISTSLSFDTTPTVTRTEVITLYHGTEVATIPITDELAVTGALVTTIVDLSFLESGNYKLWVRAEDDVNPPVQGYVWGVDTYTSGAFPAGWNRVRIAAEGYQAKNQLAGAAEIVIDHSDTWAESWDTSLMAEARAEGLYLEFAPYDHPDVDGYLLEVQEGAYTHVLTTGNTVYYPYDQAGQPVGDPIHYATFRALCPRGTYTIRIAALDLDHDLSSWSQLFTFSVPPGDFTMTAQEPVIELPAGQGLVTAILALTISESLFSDVQITLDTSRLPPGISLQGLTYEPPAGAGGAAKALRWDGIGAPTRLPPAQTNLDAANILSGDVTVLAYAALAVDQAVPAASYVLPFVGYSGELVRQAEVTLIVGEPPEIPVPPDNGEIIVHPELPLPSSATAIAVTIPPNAFTAEALVEFVQGSSNLEDWQGMSFAGTSFTLSARTHSGEPIGPENAFILELRYDPSRWGGGLEEYGLHLRYSTDEGEWLNDGIACTPDPSNDVLYCSLWQLGHLAMFETTQGNNPPNAVPNGPYPGNEGQEVLFDSIGSYDPDEDLLTYSWTFGDGFAGQGATLGHTYDDSGSYSAWLTVTDFWGLSNTQSTVAEIANVPPTAVFNHPTEVDEGQGFPLRLTDAVDLSSVDRAAGFDYDFDCGAGYGDAWSGADVATCQTDDNTTLDVAGKIRDKDGGETEYTASIAVNNVVPDVEAGADQAVFEHGIVSLDPAAFADPGMADTHTATIDWGDGTEESGSVDQEAHFVSGGHTYTQPGVYTVTVTVTDDDGGSGGDSFTVTVLHGFMGFCIYANQDVIEIAESADIDCSVGGEAFIELKKDSVVRGDVVGRDDILIGENAHVGGDATAAGTVTLESGAMVAGTVTNQAALPPVTQVGVSVSAGGPDVTVPKGETLSLPPDDYGLLNVEEDAILQLGAGDYSFDKIEVCKNARLEFELLDSGRVVIDVADTVELHEGVVMEADPDSTADILLLVAGSDVALGKDGTFLGTFIAPEANIEQHEGASLTGMLYGRQVEIKLNASVVANPAIELLTSRGSARRQALHSTYLPLVMRELR